MSTQVPIAAAAVAFAAAVSAQTMPPTSAFQQAGSLAASGTQPRITGVLQGRQARTGAEKPYAALAVTREVQSFIDGTHIDRTETVQIYQDEHGRSRREKDGAISIIDPVAGVTYDLNAATKTGTKRTLQSNGAWRLTSEYAASVTARAKQPERTAVEDLGIQVVNGVTARGRRVTITIPAGVIGNDRDIKTVNERWMSDEIQALVKSVSTDQRYGVTTYELTNIVLGPPDPVLFLPPADFKLSLPAFPGRARP